MQAESGLTGGTQLVNHRKEVVMLAWRHSGFSQGRKPKVQSLIVPFKPTASVNHMGKHAMPRYKWPALYISLGSL